MLVGTAAFALLFVLNGLLGIHTLWLSIPLWLILSLSIVWFVLAGHGAVYGPFLWLFAIDSIPSTPLCAVLVGLLFGIGLHIMLPLIPLWLNLILSLIIAGSVLMNPNS